MNQIKVTSGADTIFAEAVALLKAGKAVRLDLENGGRLHIDRPLPFLCIHILTGRDAGAANDVASANASYLIAPDIGSAVRAIESVGAFLKEHFGAFIVFDVGELERDTMLNEDSPYLPPFEITLSGTRDTEIGGALKSFRVAVEAVVAKFRVPRIVELGSAEDEQAVLARRVPDVPCLTVRFAPIYRVPDSEEIYPDLRDRVVANIFDAGLQAVAAFLESTKTIEFPSYRALGRRAFIDPVTKADRTIDEIAATFDFLLAVTPINADAAWKQFRSGKFQSAPQLLYRPLTVEIDVEKKRLFSIPFDRFEDPVLSNLYREKQQELDLQLSLISARETPRFVELGRALYGRVEPELRIAAEKILAETANMEESGADETGSADCYEVERAAQAMVAAYQQLYPEFEVEIELRDDLPAGLMVSGPRLLISRSTIMARGRLNALLSHEIGVHLLTYFNGAAQGLRIFRSGLAGYEGLQEGLAVFAEYLAGGMTLARMRLIAARVAACADMLDGASFVETFATLVHKYDFSEARAFNLTLRLYRGGGLAKDAIYLRGLLEVLDHLKKGGSLTPFWMGKIAASHFGVMQELNSRGLLRAPVVNPAFLAHPDAKKGLDRARSGLSPVEMISA